jgi:CheY-like chemotaxis protein
MKKLLIARDLKFELMKGMNFLQRAEIAVVTAATNEEILKEHVTENADLIITKLDMPGLTSESLVRTVRLGRSMREVSILLVCEDTAVERERCSACGVNAVITRPADPALFARKVLELLDVPPRRSYRVVLNAVVDGKHNNRPFLCGSLNVSTHGMLIRSAQNLSTGDHISLSFYLPDDTLISVNGEIVRAVKETSGPDDNQYGIRFVSPEPGVKAALEAFIDRELHRRSSTDPLHHTLVSGDAELLR